MKQAIIGVVIGALVAAGIAFAVLGNEGAASEGEVAYTTDVIANKLTEISELSVLEYRYKNAASSDKKEDSLKIGDISIPFTGKTLVITYEGVAKMGPDLSRATVEQQGENGIKISIPHSTILSHELDEDSFEYLVQDSGLFNPLKPEDGKKLEQQQKQVMEQSIQEQGLLDEADAKAIEQIESFIEALDPDLKVTVEVAV